MRMVTFLRAALMLSSLATAVATAPVAFAQDQFMDDAGVTHYGYFSKGDQIRDGLTPVIQQRGPALAQSRSDIRSDVGGSATANNPTANVGAYNAESILTQDGAN